MMKTDDIQIKYIKQVMSISRRLKKKKNRQLYTFFGRTLRRAG